MKTLLILALLAFPAFGQNCQIGSTSGNPPTGCQRILGYSGANLIYLCQARSVQPQATKMTVASATTASPVVFTISGGHGFDLSSLPTITLTGGTGNWTAVNITATATIINSTTLSIPVDSTSFGALAGTVVISTYAPLNTSSVWSVMKLVYSGDNLIWTGFVGGSPGERNTCTGSPSAAQ
ncbi:MAG: hypothetical protein IT282_17545 [Bacteroidetes bacterium]|nr:hypothetical protein [Bacteroidota bacterium]